MTQASKSSPMRRGRAPGPAEDLRNGASTRPMRSDHSNEVMRMIPSYAMIEEDRRVTVPLAG